jgi:biopolymer transport protein ExbD
VELNSLESALLEFNEQTPIMINCDKHASFEPFVKLIDLLKQHHYTQIGIITKQ